MTRLEPTLHVRKLRVFRGAMVAYAADFHTGVNIIRGHNASGKSTVIDFLFYALGGDGVQWKSEALLCSDVVVEVLINGAPLTLRRMVNGNAKNALSLFWGDFDAASAAPFNSWETYPYQRSTSKESFSQILFRLLKLPELRGEGASNITMHQILRLMYVDQRTPHDEIFRSEAFDTMLTRETVGNYLCGIYSNDLYDAQVELKDIESRLGKSVSDLRNLFSVLGRSGVTTVTAPEFLRAEAAHVTSEIEAQTGIVAALRRRQPRAAAPGATNDAVSKLQGELSSTQQQYAEERRKAAELRLEIEDSKLFIDELDRRLAAIEDSNATRSYLGAVRFNFCPCCLSKIEVPEGQTVCHLCKSPPLDTPADSQLLRMRNELSLQLRESQGLLQKREEALSKLTLEIPALANKLAQLESQYRATVAEWISPEDRELESAVMRLGELKQRLVQVGEYEKLAAVIENLQGKRSELESRKYELLDLIQAFQNSNETTAATARDAIATELVQLLRADLPRQEEFINAAAVDWNFGNNRLSVNGHTEFSESSMVLLKHCFHLALLSASTKYAFFRVPRFVLLDGVEDGGLERERSHNLQQLIVSLSASLPAEHQIIFATSQIDPKLEGTPLVVGKASTVIDKTLAIG